MSKCRRRRSCVCAARAADRQAQRPGAISLALASVPNSVMVRDLDVDRRAHARAEVGRARCAFSYVHVRRPRRRRSVDRLDGVEQLLELVEDLVEQEALLHDP